MDLPIIAVVSIKFALTIEDLATSLNQVNDGTRTWVEGNAPEYESMIPWELRVAVKLMVI